jgi:hypothetical protein
MLIYQMSFFGVISSTAVPPTLDAQEDIVINNPLDLDVLTYDASLAIWRNQPAQGVQGANSIVGLADTAISAVPAQNDVLVYNGAGLWVNQPLPSSSLNSNTDVSLGGLGNGEVRYIYFG